MLHVPSLSLSLSLSLFLHLYILHCNKSLKTCYHWALFCVIEEKEGKMIGWGDIYKVVVAMVPLYVALGLGYSSVRWWRIFTPEQCDAINKLVAFFTQPFFTFEFTLHIDPFNMNYRFIAADAISKLIIVLVISAWAKCSSKGSYCWSITTFSLSTLTNSLVVGVPLLTAMYGRWSQDLVVQSSVVQAIIWLTLLLFVLEVRKARTVADTGGGGGGGGSHVVSIEESTAAKGVDGRMEVVVGRRPSFWSLTKTVLVKLALNPNSLACIFGISWAFIANRWHFGMPSIVEGSVSIMSKAGIGMAMFSMGLFMAQQEKIIACGPGLTAFGMVLRFIAGRRPWR